MDILISSSGAIPTRNRLCSYNADQSTKARACVSSTSMINDIYRIKHGVMNSGEKGYAAWPIPNLEICKDCL